MLKVMPVACLRREEVSFIVLAEQIVAANIEKIARLKFVSFLRKYIRDGH